MKIRQFIVAFAAITIFSPASFAKRNPQSSRFKVFKEDSRERAKIVNRRPISLFYEKLSWNTSPTTVDAGYIFLRDQKSGSLVEFKLLETAPDSSVFNLELPRGSLPEEKFYAEMYSVPPALYKGRDRMKVVNDLLGKKALKRKPFLLRVMRRKGQIIDIFDNKQAALEAYTSYKKQLGLGPESKVSDSIIEMTQSEKMAKKEVIDTSTIQSMFLATETNEKNNNLKNKELRDVLSKIEKKRRRQVKNNEKAWSPAEKTANRTKANSFTRKAVEQKKAKKFVEARDSFLKASDLDPNVEDLYEQYGVSLYDNGKHNHSIVVLENSKPSQNRIPEKHFYLGMNYYKLKDYPNAELHFRKVMETKDKSFAPTAAYYRGTALTKLKKFDEANKSFQYVLDNSNSKELDKRAEQYIEYSIKMKTMEKKKANKWFFDGTLGAIYDSNIIFSTDSQRDAGQGQGEGLRSLVQGSVRYRPYYSKKDELSIKAEGLIMQSTKTDLTSDPTLEEADPLMGTFTLPWTHRGTLKNKGYSFVLAPGYEVINMDITGDGRETIFESVIVNFDNTLIVNKNWVAKADFELRNDDSKISGTQGEQADAIKFTSSWYSIFVLNKDLERFIIPKLKYTVNAAEGENFAFNRLDIGVTMTSSLFDVFILNGRLNYFIANYESGRNDNNYLLGTGLTYPLGAHWTAALNASYQLNNSEGGNTTTEFDYEKWTVMTTFSFSY